MKTIFKMLALMVLCMGFYGCSDDDDNNVTPSLDVTPANVAGTWKLSTWNSKPLPEGLYCYITFVRKDCTFKMYQNFDSMQARCITGEFSIEKDVYKGFIIDGTYDYWMGDWNHSYMVTLYATSMTWTAEDDNDDVCEYIRCDEIPAEIIAEAEI